LVGGDHIGLNSDSAEMGLALKRRSLRLGSNAVFFSRWRAVQSNARRRLTRSLLVEDACTSPVSKKLRFSLRKPLHVPVCENACASSPTITLHILPIENRRILLPGTAGASCVRDLRCIPLRRDTPYRRRIRLAFPNQRAARLLPTRAASETVDVRRVHVKQFVMRASQKFANLRSLRGSHPLKLLTIETRLSDASFSISASA
jgi:hypothetical protein